MDSSGLIVLCSGQPGFLRHLAGHLAGRYGLLECYSQNEAAKMTLLHRPDVALLDLRNGTHAQFDRAWAMMHNAVSTSVIVVTETGEMQNSQVPSEIADRVTHVEIEVDATDFLSAIESVDRLMGVVAAVSGDATGSLASTRQKSPVQPSDSTNVPVNRVVAKSQQPRIVFDQPSIVDRYQTRTPALRQMLERLEVAARHDVTLLLVGETGSGKTHLARLIHESSDRRAEPLLTVACGALPRDLIESELFGHVKGSFTSAHADKQGKFVAAGRGTILLDEIDALSPEQQVKLLRVIEKGLFEPVGSNETMKVEARIIAASNLELQPLVDQGKFRPDLYYRLNTLTFSIPPLRERLPDVESLVRQFVSQHAASHNVDVVSISDDFVARLVAYPWPGNVREMENAIRSAVIYCQHGQLTVETLPPNIIAGAAGPGNDANVSQNIRRLGDASLGNRIELTEKDIIEQALLQNSFSRTQTAKQLGISRVTLYNKMKKYGMMPKT